MRHVNISKHSLSPERPSITRWLWISRTIIVILLSLLLCSNAASSQSLHPADTLNKKRVKSAILIGAGTYAVAGYWMYTSWYHNTRRTGFHSFNDWNEWQNMDKYGHALTAQYQSYLTYKGARWCGIDDRKATWIGAGTALLLQSTVEVMDGFSAKWGFSWSDMAFNAGGAGLFVTQQNGWGEQRIRLKMSAGVKKYSQSPIVSINGTDMSSLEHRADDLFGKPFYERLLKDYNQQTYWLSANLKSFFPASSLPPWLNVAVGVGANNMFGGFDNTWKEDVSVFVVNQNRYMEFYLAPDIDWTRIHTDSPLLRSLFDLMSVLKFPTPGVRYDQQRGLEWLWIAW